MTTNINFRRDKDIKNVTMTVVTDFQDGSKVEYHFPNIRIDITVNEASNWDFPSYLVNREVKFEGKAYCDENKNVFKISKTPKPDGYNLPQFDWELPVVKAERGGISFLKLPEKLIELKDSGKLYTPPPSIYDLYNIEKGSKMTEIFTEITTRSTAFPKNGGNPIAASVPGYSRIPFKNLTTTLIGIDGELIYAKTLDEKRDLACTHAHILVCWPGIYAQDIFYVDDVDALKKALGLAPKKEKTRKDRKGVDWVVAE